MKALSFSLIAIGTLLLGWQGHRLKHVDNEIAQLQDQELPREPRSLPSESGSTDQNASRPLDKEALFALFKPSGKAINREDTFAGLRQLASLDLGQLREVWRSLDSPSLDLATTGWLRAVISRRLVEFDPPFILDELTTNQPEPFLARRTLYCWARNDPESARQWLKRYFQSGTPGDMSILRLALLSGVAASDPAQALKMVSELDASQYREALTTIAEHLQTPAQREAYLREITLHSDPQTRYAGLRALAYNLLNYEGFEAAADAIEAFQLEPDSKRELATAVVTNDIGPDMPQRAARLLENTPELHHNEQVHYIVARWTNSDMNAVANWLGDSEKETWYDHAVDTFTGFIRKSDPRAAVEWAQTIHEDTVRHRAVDRVLALWSQQDPEAASAYVASSALPDDLKNRWAK